MACAWSASHHGGLGGRVPSGVQGQSPWWGSGAKSPEAGNILRSRSTNFAVEMHDFHYAGTAGRAGILLFIYSCTNLTYFLKAKSTPSITDADKCFTAV